jgi:hypothetical protein
MTGPSVLRRSWAIILAAVAAMAGLLVSTTSASAEDPPGNNGTIKLDDIPFDDHPNNEPHVGCVFELDFYGYDEGDYTARTRFVVIPPTGDNIVIRRGRTFIGGDPAGGGTDLDGSATYNLSNALQSFMAHPEQGYHIKVIVNAPGSIGDDRKMKVFWVEECGPSYPGS